MTFAPQLPSEDPPVEEAGSPGEPWLLIDAWIAALALACRSYGLETSLQRARLHARWNNAPDPDQAVVALARGMGLGLHWVDARALGPEGRSPPLMIELADGRVGVITAMGADGWAELLYAGAGDGIQHEALDELARQAVRIAVVRPSRRVRDARVDAYIKPYEAHWLRRLVIRDWRPYAYVLIASLVANLLGLGGIIFAGQVYDRVIPAESFPTLYVLFSGVLLALAFDFIMRRTRHEVLDILGKSADLRLSDVVLGHALHVRSQSRPRSTGSFISQLRDLDHVREILTSTTVAALADLPFFFLFLGVMWFLAGELALVPLAGLLLMLLPGVLLQGRLRALANASMREAAMRNAMLVEAVQGMDDIKGLQAEQRFLRLWNHYNAVTAEAQLKLRALTNGLSSWANTVQMLVFAGVIVLGAPMAIAGDITTGGLVAASLLGSRMIAPMAQLTQVLGRLQQARIAAQSVDTIMALPVDHAPHESRVHLPAIVGDYTLRDAVFRHGDDTTPVALSVAAMDIRAGERIAVLGRNGAGKSTLLRALAGLMQPSAGEILLEGVALAHIDPADLRRDIGFVGQEARMFHGTLRDNLLMGAPQASDEAMMRCLALTGALSFVRRLPKGLDQMVGEGGSGFSQGQRQMLLLSRQLLRQPQIVLLDEPTASLDEAAERAFVTNFGDWSVGKTVIIATHRMRALDLVDRVIVVDNGRITLDAPRDEALQRLGKAAKVSKVAPASMQPAGAQSDGSLPS